jgi:hypothetical protein
MLVDVVLVGVVAVASTADAQSFAMDRFEASAQQLPEASQKLARDVVTRVALVSTESGRCSGALVDADLVLTAWHCVDRVRQQIVRFRGINEDFRSHVVAFDRAHDLAVLQLDRPAGLIPLPIQPHSSDLVSGAALITIGHPWTGLFRVTAGRAIEPGDSFFLFNAEVSFGNSGGPIFNEQGRIVGVAIILNRFIGDRELGDASAAGPVRKILKDAQSRQLVSWREARGSLVFDLAYGRDTLQMSRHRDESATLVYAIGWDFYDRWRVAFRHFTLRPDRVRGFETGPVFKTWFGQPALLVGRNYYDVGSKEVAVNKYGIGFELLFFDVTLFHLDYGDQKYSSLTIGL